jgi:hypothetical protein
MAEGSKTKGGRASSKSKSRSNGTTSSSRKKTSAGSSRSGASAKGRDSASKSTSKAASTASKAAEPATAAREAATAGTVAAGKAVAAAAGKLKAPILLGGMAVAGVVGGAAIRNRIASTRSRGFGRRLSSLDLDSLTKLDFDKIAAAADRVGAYGRQIDEVAGAVRRASETAKQGKK